MISVENGKVQIDVLELIEAMDEEERSHLAQSLGIVNGVFEAVCDRLIDGRTKDGCYVLPDDQAEKWRAKLLESVPKVAFELVERLMNDRVRHMRRLEEVQTWAWNMYHAWPEEAKFPAPHFPPHDPPQLPSRKEIQHQVDQVLEDTAVAEKRPILWAWYMENRRGWQNNVSAEAAEYQVTRLWKTFGNHLDVVSTHQSKNCILPVFGIDTVSGLTLTFRGNFHNWQISVLADRKIELRAFTNLGNDITSRTFFIRLEDCEGFPKERWSGNTYFDNKREFTITVWNSIAAVTKVLRQILEHYGPTHQWMVPADGMDHE